MFLSRKWRKHWPKLITSSMKEVALSTLIIHRDGYSQVTIGEVKTMKILVENEGNPYTFSMYDISQDELWKIKDTLKDFGCTVDD